MENQDQRESNLYPEYQNYQAGGSPASSRQNGQPANGLATASLVMGILAVVMTCCCYGGLIFGGLGVLFALLSKGNGPMSGRARAGLGLSLGGLILYGECFLLQDFPDTEEALNSVLRRFPGCRIRNLICRRIWLQG